MGALSDGRVYPRAAIYKIAETIAADIIEHAEHMQKGIGWKNSMVVQPLLGMAHGNAGIGVALSCHGVCGNLMIWDRYMIGNCETSSQS